MELITFDQAREGLHKAVEAKGSDYIYQDSQLFASREQCLYVGHQGEWDEVDGWTETPVVGCIVGEAFDRLGLFGDGSTRNGLFENLIDVEDNVQGIAKRFGVPITERALEYLQAAQRMQDKGRTWGDAVMTADDMTFDHLQDDSPVNIR